GADLAKQLLKNEQSVVMLHGDMHHKNIKYSARRGWLAFDPQPLIGERAYDVANIFYNPDDLPNVVERPERIDRLCRIFATELNQEPGRILAYAFVYGCLSVCWQIEDGEDPRRRLRIAQLVYDRLRTLN